MNLHTAFFLFLFNLAHGAVANPLAEIAHSKEWRSLLYANEWSWFGVRSRSDGPAFFVTENGAKDIVAELEASVALVQSESVPLNDQSFSCRFPARSEFIHQEILNKPLIDQSGCKKLTEWRERLAAESVTLVFSSFYLGNPSSTFGHTLLRVNNSGKNKTIRRELLSYGINYGAIPWTENPVLYTFNGLFGFFPGNFIAIPYYYKVREYNDYESRDLWEYDLDLTAEEVARVVDLIWEQGDNQNDYYFLTENCGYYIAALLEAAAPRYDIVSKLRKWVIPSDTIAQMAQAGIIKSRKLRPSIYNQFLQRLEQLNEHERSVLTDLEAIKTERLVWPSSYNELSADKKALVLDAALDYRDYKTAKALVLDGPQDRIKAFYLNERSRLPVARPLSYEAMENNPPEMAHGSFRWQITGLAQNEHFPSYLLGSRFAFHDLEDPLPGEPPGAHIEVFNIVGRWRNEALMLERLNIVEIGSYTAWSQWAPKSSYHLSLGLLRVEQDRLCLNWCQTGQFEFGYGLSKGSGPFLVSALFEARYLHGRLDSDNHKNGWNYLAVGPRLILQWDPSSEHQFRIEGRAESLSTTKEKLWRSELVYRWNAFIDSSVELKGEVNNDVQALAASVYFFSF
jgi:Domain of unknown function (DUF4105)